MQDTLNAVQQAVQQYPNVTGFWTVCDLCVLLIAQALDSKGIKGPAGPIVSGEFSTPQTVVDIREGSVDGVMDEPWEASAWVAIDKALDLWAHKKKIPAKGTNVYRSGYGLKFLEPFSPEEQHPHWPSPDLRRKLRRLFQGKVARTVRHTSIERPSPVHPTPAIEGDRRGSAVALGGRLDEAHARAGLHPLRVDHRRQCT